MSTADEPTTASSSSRSDSVFDRQFFVFLALILFGAAALRSINLTEPCESGWHMMGLRQALAARNYLRFGFVETRGAMILNGSDAAPDEFQAYVHHPQLLPILLAPWFAMVGDTIVSFRVFLICMALATITLLALLVRHFVGARPALMAALVLSVTPMAAIFATGGDVHGEGVMTFVLLGLFGRLVVGARHPRSAKLLEYTGYTLAAAHDWAGFLAFGIPLLDTLLWQRNRRNVIEGLASIGASAVLFFGFRHWGHEVVASSGFRIDEGNVGTGGYWSTLDLIGDLRSFPEIVFARFADWADEQSHLWTYPAIAAWVIAVVSIVALRRSSTVGDRRLVRLSLLTLAPGAGFLLMMMRLTLVHAYATIFLAPGLALVATIGLTKLSRAGRSGGAAAALIVLGAAASGVWTTIDRMQSLRTPDYAAVISELSSISDPDDLIVSPDGNDFVVAFLTRRHCIGSVRFDDQKQDRIGDYMRRRPTAGSWYVLPPLEKLRVAPFVKQQYREEYSTLRKDLDATWAYRSVQGFRIYDLTHPKDTAGKPKER